MAKPKSKIEHALHLKQQGIRLIEDFPLDHKAMRVPETPEMAALRGQIEALQAQHAALQEAQQLGYWKAFLHVAKYGPFPK